jgi:hypothetical protein
MMATHTTPKVKPVVYLDAKRNDHGGKTYHAFVGHFDDLGRLLETETLWDYDGPGPLARLRFERMAALIGENAGRIVITHAAAEDQDVSGPAMCCPRCAEMGRPVEGEGGLLTCGKGHFWVRRNDDDCDS